MLSPTGYGPYAFTDEVGQGNNYGHNDPGADHPGSNRNGPQVKNNRRPYMLQYILQGFKTQLSDPSFLFENSVEGLPHVLSLIHI